MKCQNQPDNKRDCTCTYEPCPRKGVCCECIRYHLQMKEVPACLFSKKGEASYDRSIESFIKDFKRM